MAAELVKLALADGACDFPVPESSDKNNVQCLLPALKGSLDVPVNNRTWQNNYAAYTITMTVGLKHVKEAGSVGVKVYVNDRTKFLHNIFAQELLSLNPQFSFSSSNPLSLSLSLSFFSWYPLEIERQTASFEPTKTDVAFAVQPKVIQSNLRTEETKTVSLTVASWTGYGRTNTYGQNQDQSLVSSWQQISPAPSIVPRHPLPPLSAHLV